MVLPPQQNSDAQEQEMRQRRKVAEEELAKIERELEQAREDLRSTMDAKVNLADVPSKSGFYNVVASVPVCPAPPANDKERAKEHSWRVAVARCRISQKAFERRTSLLRRVRWMLRSLIMLALVASPAYRHGVENNHEYTDWINNKTHVSPKTFEVILEVLMPLVILFVAWVDEKAKLARKIQESKIMELEHMKMAAVVEHEVIGQSRLDAPSVRADYNSLMSRTRQFSGGALAAAEAALGVARSTGCFGRFRKGRPDPLELPVWHKNGTEMISPANGERFSHMDREKDQGIIRNAAMVASEKTAAMTTGNPALQLVRTIMGAFTSPPTPPTNVRYSERDNLIDTV